MLHILCDIAGRYQGFLQLDQQVVLLWLTMLSKE
jgi:hypothetical protein